MTYQKCPVCEGIGAVTFTFPTPTPCTTCNGHKIIHTETGKPPEDHRTRPLSQSQLRRLKVQKAELIPAPPETLAEEFQSFIDALKSNPLRNKDNV